MSNYIIHTVSEKERGCGWRKAGGLYLVGGGPAIGCCKLPFKLEVCPCCGTGIKPTRGFTWISSDLFQFGDACIMDDGCPLTMKNQRMGLLWVGEMFYKSTAAFNREADALGISRRIATVPHGFKVGKTCVALAHRKAVIEYNDLVPVFIPGVFRVFRPQRIEYVVKGTESEQELQDLFDRGLTLVLVAKEPGTEQALFNDATT